MYGSIARVLIGEYQDYGRIRKNLRRVGALAIRHSYSQWKKGHRPPTGQQAKAPNVDRCTGRRAKTAGNRGRARRDVGLRRRQQNSPMVMACYRSSYRAGISVCTGQPYGRSLFGPPGAVESLWDYPILPGQMGCLPAVSAPGPARHREAPCAEDPAQASDVAYAPQAP
jgi:hypothetical protein